MEIKLPQGANVRIEGGSIIVKMGSEEQQIFYDHKKIKVEIANGSLNATSIKKVRRKTHASINAFGKHLKNMLEGSKNAYVKKMQVVYAHFPISIEVKGNKISIKNFLGEKVPREANIIGKTSVVVSGQEITVKGPNKDHVGQTAANIIQSVRIVGKDRRVFQDGIYPAG